MKFKTIEWKGDRVRILDQRRLPQEVRYLDCRDASSVTQAIRTMAIRGAPAIGVAAAMGIALAAKKTLSHQPEAFRKSLEKVCREMRQTRPTAVNLFWAVDRMKKILDQVYTHGVDETKERLVKEALNILKEDIEINRKIGMFGKRLIKNGDRVLTHCNAGALATAGYGTALGVIYAAWAEGKRFCVFADETRPQMQGARLTAWELVQKKIPVTIVTDNMAGWLMEKGQVNLVLVGADRIARNGDTANKIGTYSLAVLSKWHGVPFYVAAPTSTLDLTLDSGLDIPIEERDIREVTHFRGYPIAPKGVKAFNPAFDVTPHSLVHAIITEKGLIRKPFEKNLKRIKV
ncbi:MAG: S-methyl-5-thioribose-1-phosphate isomerase [Deltaproteobacteria bacterium CG_4_8_14_3_um_filter_45_9]|nr:MAG: S-methyl-5-thioribose-1-phosphate isomerase [Deltaproteobacteria bacterium CG_4_8_14_3_um_filter_45_9]